MQDRTEYMKRYRLENKERFKELNSRYYQENKDNLKENFREYYIKTRSRRRELGKIHYEENKSFYLAYSKIRKATIKRSCPNSLSEDDYYQIKQIYLKCKENEIQPILGYEAYVSSKQLDSDDENSKKNYHINIFAKNNNGYKAIIKLVTYANINNFFRKPRVTLDELSKYAGDIVITTACVGSQFSQLILENKLNECKSLLLEYKKIFKDDFLRTIKFETTAAQAESLGINVIAKNVNAKMTELLGWQSLRIAQTEVLSAASVAQNESVKSVGVPYQKTWVAAMINTRHSHKAMHGTIAKNDGMFVLPDGSKMEYPRDARFGAPAGEIINCQCFVIYEPKRDW